MIFPRLCATLLFASLALPANIALASGAGSFGANLVYNGGAEIGTLATGWIISKEFTTLLYGTGGGFPSLTDPGPADRGSRFFSGGSSNASAEAMQSIDISFAASDIDAGNASFNLSAYLGGYGPQDDNAKVTASFFDAAGTQLGLTTTIGPVMAADRNNKTGLLLRETGSVVPAQARTVRITILLTRLTPNYNDGYADNISFVLTNAKQSSQAPSAATQTIGPITFAPSTLPVGGTSAVSATATSGLAVTFTSLTPDTCTIATVKSSSLFSPDSYAVMGIAGGTCTIAANQAGGVALLGGAYGAASQVTQNITVGITRNDCIFNWAEKNYSQYFAPAGATDGTYTPYTYRYYSDTGNYLAISSADDNVYVMGPSFGETPAAVGPATSFLGVSGCQADAPICTSPQVIQNGVCVTPTTVPSDYVSQGGLTWIPTSTTRYTYTQATALCAAAIKGQSGWRLPTETELRALYLAYPNNSSGLPKSWTAGYTWSSTPSSAGYNHETVDLRNGYIHSASDTGDINYVTCVR